jgi:hypothetical protein
MRYYDLEAGIDRHVDIERAGERLRGKEMKDRSGGRLLARYARGRLLPTFGAASLRRG